MYDDTLEDSYEVHPQKGESDEEDHAGLKASKKDDIEDLNQFEYQRWKPDMFCRERFVDL